MDERDRDFVDFVAARQSALLRTAYLAGARQVARGAGRAARGTMGPCDRRNGWGA